MEDSYEVDACVRGYHIYQDVWRAEIGQILPCSRETDNTSDPYAVAIKCERKIVGHVPRLLSSACSLFLLNGGSISCTITGSRRYSRDLVQGGMEVPCKFKFTGGKNNINKVKKLIGLVSLPWKTDSQTLEVLNSPENKGDCSSKIWLRHEKFVLNISDKDDIESGMRLSDKHINFSQVLLKEQFPNLHGLDSTLLVANKPATVPDKSNYLQIIHCMNNHWITISTIGIQADSNTVNVYDSLYAAIDIETASLLQVLFGDDVQVRIKECPRQNGVDDCGIFAIAVCAALGSTGQLPERFNQERMRIHLLECLNSQVFSLFPIV